MFDIPHADYFLSGNFFSGSSGLFRFQIAPGEDVLQFFVWEGPYCKAKSKILKQTETPMTEDGLAEGIAWLEEAYREMTDEAPF